MKKALNNVLTVLVAFLFAIICADITHAQYYQWEDENGVIHLTNKPVAQEKDKRNIRPVSRDKGANQPVGSEWFSCDEGSQRAGHAAANLLKDQEGWTTQPSFDRNVRQFVNGFIVTRHFWAHLPKTEVAAAGCSSGYRVVKVKIEEDAKNRGRCRILDVSPGNTIMEPPGCKK